MSRVAIIDFGMGNLFSVAQACSQVGMQPVVVSQPDDLAGYEAAILPGVGAFPSAMESLRSSGMDNAIKNLIRSGKPLLGVCLGFQLLFEQSEEFENVRGLGVLPGAVRRFPSRDIDGERLPVPQVGWNQVEFAPTAASSELFKDISDGTFFYFVHSYYVAPSQLDIQATLTRYGGFPYCSSVISGNVLACQFHPEKSGPEGLKIYRNWSETLKNNPSGA